MLRTPSFDRATTSTSRRWKVKTWGLGDAVRLSVAESEPVVSSLIKHVFFRTFRREYPEVVPLSFYPFRILSRKDEDDMVAGLLSDDLKGKLSRKKQFEVHFREIELDGSVAFGAVINLRYRWIFSETCLDLRQDGFDLVGKQVLLIEELPGLAGIIAPDESLVGPITSIEGSRATIETNEGEETYSLADLHLHRSFSNIEDYLNFKLGERKTSRILEQVDQKDRTRLDAGYYFREVERIARWLTKLEYRNKDNFAFSIAAKPQGITNSFRIHAPSFLFDYNPGASDGNASRGLTEHGPYDSSTFDVKHPKVLAVLHKNHRGGFTDFLGKLKSGIPHSSSFKSGLVGKYRLYDVTFETVELENYGVREYAEKIVGYIREQDTLPNLAVVETKEEFKQLPSESNPYYRVKTYLLSLGIPVQFIKNKNVRKPDRFLQWICESVALQVYAKLGGRPWVLPASSSIDHEIVVGIGSSMLRKNLFVGAPQQRIVGITTFFTGDGRYIFGNRCKEIPFERYFDELLSSLRSSIRDISADYNWRDGDTVRIVFHVFKPIKNVEAEVVDALLREFTQYDIRYCFVTISDRHPFLLFDKDQDGIGSKAKGRYVPQRGTNWVLGPHACLLQLKGPDDIRSERHGFGSPVLVRVHEGSTFLDLNTVVQQISNFTHLSWRGFNAAQQPATILYSELIAKNLSHMRKIESWKPELTNSLLRDKKWFL